MPWFAVVIIELILAFDSFDNGVIIISLCVSEPYIEVIWPMAVPVNGGVSDFTR